MREEKEFIELLDIYYKSWFRINDIYRVWSKNHGIHDTTLFVLYVINDSPYCTQNEICDKLFLPKQTVSLILSGLEDNGYIQREINPKDRRNKVVKFTEHGHKYAKAILDELKTAEIEALSNMSEKQRKAMAEIFTSLPDLLSTRLSK